MCGICGFFYRDRSRPVSEKCLDIMVDKMIHRGPDDRGIFCGEGGALGHRRLTIIDLVGGRQPMKLSGGQAALVTNGEIYNYTELRKEYLQDIQFESSSDTEVLLHLLYRKGIKAIPLLNGMFAFAYWDIQNRKLILGRDPAGQKPLFYYFGTQTFVFASELSSLACHPDVPKDIDHDSLAYYLLFEGYPHPFTPLKNVNKLSPGCFIVLDLQKWTLQKERYWEDIPDPQPFGSADEKYYLKTFSDKFTEAVRLSLRADVKVGIFLSGGLDSPSLVKAAVNILGSQSVETFTIKHELDSFNEAADARETADYFGTRHHEKLLRKEEFLSDIDPLLRNNDEPIADPGFLAIYQVAKFSREYVKVILSGNGGDEFYAGYAPFQALKPYNIGRKLLPQFLVRFLSILATLPEASHEYMNIPFRIQRFLRGISSPPAEVLYQWIGSFNHHEMQNLFNKDLSVAPLFQSRDSGYPALYGSLHEENARLASTDMISRLLHIFQQFYLPVCICNHSDKASMRVSQELRSPFLDTNLMRFANQLPSRMKYRKGKTKYILRKYHEQNSPSGVSTRPKIGFTVPIASWLTTALKSWADDILDPAQIEKDGFFNAKEVRRLWNEHQRRKANHAKKLWTVIVFQHWLHSSFEGWKSVDG